jgi:2-iminobutanoate/2-iminopropanoate deaminase
MREIIETQNAPAPIGPYSQAVRVNGFIFVSGQIPVRPATGLVEGEDITAQTHQVMKNLEAILAAAGKGLDSVVKTTVFLSDLDDFSGFNQVYEKYFAAVKPARATVQVARLPKNVLLEIEAIAVA